MVWHRRASSYVVVNLDDAELFEVTPQDALSYAREDILSGFRVLIEPSTGAAERQRRERTMADVS